MKQKHFEITSGFDSEDTLAWHRWLQPLQGVMASHQAPLDRDKIDLELLTCVKGGVSLTRAQLLTCLRTHLDAAKARLRHEFYESNDGAVYVGMHAWTIDILLQLLYAKTQKHVRWR